MPEVFISPTAFSLSRTVARLVASWIRYKPDALICIASGESTIGICQEIVKQFYRGHADISQITFVGLDEWVGMDQYDEGSCKSYLYKYLFNQLPLVPEQIQYFDAKASDLQAECERINQLIANHGGIDIMIVGVGLNGHIALNEPGTPFESYAHISDLDEMTISVGQKYFSKQTPLSQGITLGLQHLKEAKKPILVANGYKKASIISEALKGEVGTHLPASIFQTLPNAKIYLDPEAASALGKTNKTTRKMPN